MVDIAKCANESCKLKDTCWRYTAPPGYWQSYGGFSPDKDGNCDAYWNVKDRK
jgi:hypothetical protein